MHVDSLTELDQRLAHGATLLGSWSVHGLDLRGRAAELLERDLVGATFLGCRLEPHEEQALHTAGALVLPAATHSPLESHRAELYTAEELYDATTYAASRDAAIYAWSQQVPQRRDTLVAALHDHAIDEALHAWRAGRTICGVMGGHALQRGEPGYADAARLGQLLGRDQVVATGGGPGAMEAANLGARLAAEGAPALERALERVACVPSFAGRIDEWVRVARTVLADLPHTGQDTLGVPTWFYGHEPSNLFATVIAKYVANALREAVLLEICDAGIVFLPGAAGTVQEVFQDACENYYGDQAEVAPMVLVGREHWTETIPAWPLLQRLAQGRVMEHRVHLVDTVDEAVEIIRG